MKLINDKAKFEEEIKQKNFEKYEKYCKELAEKDKKMFEMKRNIQNIEHEKKMILMDNEKLKKINQMNEESQKKMNQYIQNINQQRINPYIPYNNSYYVPLDNYSYIYNSNTF